MLAQSSECEKYIHVIPFRDTEITLTCDTHCVAYCDLAVKSEAQTSQTCRWILLKRWQKDDGIYGNQRIEKGNMVSFRPMLMLWGSSQGWKIC